MDAYFKGTIIRLKNLHSEDEDSIKLFKKMKSYLKHIKENPFVTLVISLLGFLVGYCLAELFL